MRRAERILTLSHGHPDFAKGGGEIAAYNLYQAYAASPDVEASWFLARADRRRGPCGRITQRRENEFLWEQSTPDIFTMRAVNRFEVLGYFSELIRTLRPTIVHAHHFIHLGIEVFGIIKNIDPSIQIILTLHEYLAICHNNGQMVKTGEFRLCYESSLEDCTRCFPERTPEEFWLRQHNFTHFFSFVDQFVSPSQFLKDRYVQWGIPADRIEVIENGQADRRPLAPRRLEEGEKRNRFGFFGQINPYKGVTVLLRALAAMTPDERKELVLEVHGANLEHQPQAFQNEVERLRRPLQEEGVLQWIGPYEGRQMASRLKEIDWVLVPSVWWENSPMVIQEAFAHGKPVIGSDIGGMAEKIVDQVNGLHVNSGNAYGWRSTLLSAARSETLWHELYANIQAPISYAECARRHLELL
nr:glycosyltransferase family 4 protein [Enterobacter roggenkampii]